MSGKIRIVNIMQQHHRSLVRMPQSLWARVILVLLGLGLLWQVIIGQQVDMWGFVVGMMATIAIANSFENQQQQIYRLHQQIFDLEQQIKQGEIQTTHTPQVPVQPIFVPNIAAQEPYIVQGSASVPVSEPELNCPEPQPEQHKELQVMTSLWDAALNWFKGGNSIVRIAVVILLIGVILLLRFASEYWQLTLSAKMAGVALGGFALIGLGYVLRQKRFDYAISLQGAGLGIVFLVLFSSYHLGVIQSIGLSYAGLMALLAGTLLLALRQNALILAFIALGSGFIAPFILNTGSNDIPALMAYYFALNTALAVIAWFKPWRILNTIALLMTFGIGGFAIWLNAEPAQYLQLSCWVWAIFTLYLFISIRYSQIIAQLGMSFKDIPVIDSTLIFATPFMAFSLYAGLVDSDGYALSIASGVLAVVYVVMGYVLHQKSQQLSILAQCFYGLGLVFTALILPFAFDAYWTSVGWAIHGVVMIWLGWRYAMANARYFGVVLLLASGVATFISAVFHHQQVLFANTVLMCTYAIAAYCLYYPYREQSQPLRMAKSIEKIMAYLLIGLSFAVLAPYQYGEIVRSIFDRIQYNFGLATLLWYLILTLAYWLKEKTFHKEWGFISAIILFLTAIGAKGILLSTQGLGDFYLHAIELDAAKKLALVWDSTVWCFSFWLYIRYIQPATTEIYKLVQQVLMVLAIGMLAILGSIWSAAPVSLVLLVVLPLVVFIASLRIEPFKILQPLWIGNLGVMVLGLSWLWVTSMTDAGDGKMAYVMLVSPVDMGSILVFILLLATIKPYLLSTQREIQIFSAITVLTTGLLCVSSIMLRMLHHYADLPYWSGQAWENSTVQMSLTILWASIALVLTTLASRKAWRYIWMVGIAVLAVVIAKLIFLDLSHSHTLTRIISFIGSGLIMLVIGYFAPLPPAQRIEDETQA